MGDGDNDYVYDLGFFFRRVLLRLVGLGVINLWSGGVVSFFRVDIEMRVAFLLHPLAVTNLLKCFPASSVAFLRSSDLGV